MALKKSFTEKVSKTVIVNFEPSKKGGSKSVTVEIPVEINLEFDSQPFTQSVKECEENIISLTNAVNETEKAEVKAREDSSMAVAKSILDGFFGYIRSEISQQAQELKQNADSMHIVLNELMKKCSSLKDQMSKDFKRISDRYIKIFQDLNKELSFRIFELNKPAFTFEKETNNHKSRVLNTDLINTVGVFGTECGSMLSRLSVSIAKKRAHETIIKSKSFLLNQKSNSAQISNSLIDEEREGKLYVPALFIETTDDKGFLERRLFSQELLTQDTTTHIWSNLLNSVSSTENSWSEISPYQLEELKQEFLEQLEKRIPYSNTANSRIKETLLNIADFGKIKILRN